ncbi:MAG: methionine--tRNA ligase [Verrucomicrobia bacterium]|nr:MAG: methionine--tRNA ligase [Verrucomicrobiota bacterium]
MSKFYITTAIDYANGTPHLGHAYEKVLTDVIARYRRLMGDDVTFLTGLDEHGQKVQQSARDRGIEPIELCDEAAGQFQDLCRRLLISNDDFIRTTEERHKKVVNTLLQQLYDDGQIYQAEYTGYYSARAEQFLQEKDRVDGEWPEIYGDVVEISEKNYFFKLSQYQDWLIQYVKAHEDFIFPRFRAKQVIEFLKEPINDLCISRPKERLSWGIPLPFDPDYVTYVWFDALTNYISAVGYGTDSFSEYWPADFHVIGKDILVPPHAVYWPIMLKACGIELPKSLLVHGWWLTAGRKLSKSTGVVVNPLDLIDQFGADAFRYFVTREMNVGQDSEFSLDLFLSRYNSDLANDLGNLVNRTLNMTGRYLNREIAAQTDGDALEQEVRENWARTRDEVIGLYEEFQFHTALDRTFAFIKSINRYAEQRAPWKLAKSEDPADRELLGTCLSVMAESLRLATALAAPVMPGITDKVAVLLGHERAASWQEELEWSTVLSGNTLGEPTILFPRTNSKKS